MSRTKWKVRLGDAEWARYTYPRPPGGELRLLGSVTRGPQVGALAVTNQGEYVQVVGDHEVHLNRSQLAKVISAREKAEPYRLPHMSRASVPVVVLKRRRIPLMV